MRTKRSVSTLEQVRRQFDDWRRTRQRRTRIPNPLWRAAVEVARVHGVYRTAKTLGINSASLKKRMEQDGAESARAGRGGQGSPVEPAMGMSEASAAAGATFLELPPPPWTAGSECILELEDAGGARMRVCLKSLATPDLAALSRSFWEATS